MNSNIDLKTGLLVEDHRRVNLDLYFYKYVAAETLNISQHHFDKLGLKPDKAVTNPRHERGPIAYLYEKKRIYKLLPKIRVMTCERLKGKKPNSKRHSLE